jgi:predicted GNAT superfamily acetyltransferase
MMEGMTKLATADTAGQAAQAADQAAQAADQAVQAAEQAAQQAGVLVRDLADLDELTLAVALFGRVWPGEPGSGPCTLDVLRALSKTGNYVSGAFQGEDLVGACVGFFGPPAEASMHSHVTAVAPGLRGRNLGFTIKLHQRAWALRRSVTRVTWTYDPLVSRNAYFNLGKLGATAVEYLPNFYGQMTDTVNAGDESDRLVCHWDLKSDRVVQASRGNPPAVDLAELQARGAVTALSADPQGAPVVGSSDAAVVLVGVPPDIESLRTSDPDTARAWRYALRGVLGALLDAGGRVTGFAKSGWYVVERPAG